MEETLLTPFMQLAFLLVVIIVAAKSAGYLAIRLGQPSVLGELLVGVLLGPSLLNILHLPFLTDHALPEIISQIGEIGVLMLMFIAGLELHLDELTRNTKVSALAGILGVLAPAALGWSVGRLFGMDNNASLFLGLTLGATSVSISAQTLMELKVLRSRVGLGLLGAAVFDDVLVILLLSLFFAFTSGADGLLGSLLVLGKMLLFFALAAAFGIWALPRIVRKVRGMPVSQNILTLAVVIMLSYGIAAEVIGGMAAITGTFLAGLMFARSPEKEALEPRIAALAYGFFVPVFFVNIGLAVDVRGVISSIPFMLAITIVAIIGKFLGSGGGARLAGFSNLESAQVGVGMISRGEVGLIVASQGMLMNMVVQDEFSAILGMVIITTLITPPILRYLFHINENKTPESAKLEKETS